MSKENNMIPVQTGQITAKNNFNFFDPVQFDTMQRVCGLFANSELVPDMYKAKILPGVDDTTKAANALAMKKATANCMIAISMAMRINADPLMVMQNMVIIYGKPSWSSKFLIATINSCGRFRPLKFRIEKDGVIGKIDITEYEWNERTRRKEAKVTTFDGSQIPNIRCVAYTTEKDSDEILESTPVDLRMAVEEGWYTKNGSKWRTMPDLMLRYRTASMWCSVYAPEISMGMKTEEEIRDIEDADFIEIKTPDQRVAEEKANNANAGVIDMDAAAASGSESPSDAKPESKPKPKSNQEPAKDPNNPDW